jgi:hypothetical protein
VIYLVPEDSLTLQVMDLPLIVAVKTKVCVLDRDVFVLIPMLNPPRLEIRPRDVIRTEKELQQAYRENWQSLKNKAA